MPPGCSPESFALIIRALTRRCFCEAVRFFCPYAQLDRLSDVSPLMQPPGLGHFGRFSFMTEDETPNG